MVTMASATLLFYCIFGDDDFGTTVISFCYNRRDDLLHPITMELQTRTAMTVIFFFYCKIQIERVKYAESDARALTGPAVRPVRRRLSAL